MNNEKIIEEIAMTIYGEDAVRQMLERGEEIPLHTVKGWAARGPYRVKKGEHGIETRLWKRKKGKSIGEEGEDSPEDETNNQGFYLCKSFLFRDDQVERC